MKKIILSLCFILMFSFNAFAYVDEATGTEVNATFVLKCMPKEEFPDDFSDDIILNFSVYQNNNLEIILTKENDYCYETEIPDFSIWIDETTCLSEKYFIYAYIDYNNLDGYYQTIFTEEANIPHTWPINVYITVNEITENTYEGVPDYFDEEIISAEMAPDNFEEVTDTTETNHVAILYVMIIIFILFILIIVIYKFYKRHQNADE